VQATAATAATGFDAINQKAGQAGEKIRGLTSGFRKVNEAFSGIFSIASRFLGIIGLIGAGVAEIKYGFDQANKPLNDANKLAEELDKKLIEVRNKLREIEGLQNPTRGKDSGLVEDTKKYFETLSRVQELEAKVQRTRGAGTLAGGDGQAEKELAVQRDNAAKLLAIVLKGQQIAAAEQAKIDRETARQTTVQIDKEILARREAEDAAALAFASLPVERRADLLQAVPV
jgi:hypothetical protein